MYNQAIRIPGFCKCFCACSKDSDSHIEVSTMSSSSLRSARTTLDVNSRSRIDATERSASQSALTTWDLVRRGFRMQRYQTKERTVSREEAAWYFALPDKIKRRHFTTEEQVWMQAQSEFVLSKPPGSSSSSNSLNRDRAQGSRRPRTAPTTVSAVDHQSPFARSAMSLTQPSKSLQHECFELPAEVPLNFGRSQSSIDQWPLRSHPVRIVPIDKSASIAPSSPSLPIQVPSPSLQSLPSSSSILGLPRTSPRMVQTARRASPPLPINTSSAIYIGDPENMSKVRDLLSSPLLPHGPSSAPCKQELGLFQQSFCSDASIRDDDASSSVDASDPITPEEPLTKLGRAKSSYFSFTSPFHSPAHTPVIAPVHSHFDDFLKSDVTLKLTLTRPEIRAGDDVILARKRPSTATQTVPRLPELFQPIDEMDPLALDPLVFSDDSQGQHCPFANDEAMNKKKGLKGFFAKKRAMKTMA